MTFTRNQDYATFVLQTYRFHMVSFQYKTFQCERFYCVELSQKDG